MNDIAKAYDSIAGWFDDKRTRSLIEQPWLDALMTHVAPGAAILDLGCGTGEPILRYLIERGYVATGVDASAAMLAIARTRFPDTRLVLADMRSLALGARFDAIVVWHSLFHLAPDEQRAMFRTFARHLHSGGLLMFTSGTEHGETWSENGGEALYHASLDRADYRSLLEAHGFQVMRYVENDAACGGATVWLAGLAA